MARFSRSSFGWVDFMPISENIRLQSERTVKAISCRSTFNSASNWVLEPFEVAVWEIGVAYEANVNNCFKNVPACWKKGKVRSNCVC